MTKASFAFLCACAALLSSPAALAWGQIGHRVVAELAQSRLTPVSRAAVADLLKGEADATLAGNAVWADDVRKSEPAYQWTAALHWVNFEPGNCHYDAAHSCADGLCVVGGIERFSSELADRELPRARRIVALKFLVHFVGDIHQPLHAGYARDRGGNEFQINYLRDGWNLHSVWDSLLIESLQLNWRSYAERLEAMSVSRSLLDQAGIESSATWAEESCRISQAADFYPPRHKITRDYLESHRPVADERLRLAGERLAQRLNHIFDPASDAGR